MQVTLCQHLYVCLSSTLAQSSLAASSLAASLAIKRSVAIANPIVWCSGGRAVETLRAGLLDLGRVAALLELVPTELKYGRGAAIVV